MSCLAAQPDSKRWASVRPIRLRCHGTIIHHQTREPSTHQTAQEDLYSNARLEDETPKRRMGPGELGEGHHEDSQITSD